MLLQALLQAGRAAGGEGHAVRRRLVEALSHVRKADPVPLILPTDLDGAVFTEEMIQVREWA